MSPRTFLKTWSLILILFAGALSLTLSPASTAGPAPGPFIRLRRATFDPLVETTDLPDDLTLRAYPPGASGSYLVQFKGPVQQAWKAELRRLGAQLFDYVPDYTFLVRMDEATATRVAGQPAVRWVGLYQPAYRLSPRLDGVKGLQTVTLQTLPGVDRAALRAKLEGLGATIQAAAFNRFGGYFRLAVDGSRLSALARLDPVVWVEPYAPPRLLNDVARGAGILDAEKVWQELGLYGEGQVVAVCDAGLDKGVDDGTMSADFAGRIVSIQDLDGQAGDGADDRCSGHGTHVAGSALGSGVNSGSDPAGHDYAGSQAGVAPEAGLVFQAIEWADTPPITCPLSIPADLNNLFQQAYDDGARIHNNSWGNPMNGDYTVWAQQTDQFAWDHKDMTILFAAGNTAVDADEDGIVDPDSLDTPSTAKNCITVGASENDRPVPSPNNSSGTWSEYLDGWQPRFPAEPIFSDETADAPGGMAAFSGRGPADDGRIKPDLVAPGTWILSAYSQANHPKDGGTQYDGLGNPPNRWYKYMGGTSTAAPLTSGAAALVRDYYNDVAGLATPSSALIKATLINGAYDMTPGQYGAGTYREISGRPDRVQGWGRVDVANALIPDPPRTWWQDDHTSGLSTGDVVTYTSKLTTPLTVMDAGEPLRVSLVWTDYPGSPAADGGLVNDLDLTVTVMGDIHYHGNGVYGDRTNNVEGVDILVPPLEVYTITVRAHNVTQGTQPYALVVSGALGDAACRTLGEVRLDAPEVALVGREVAFTAMVSPTTATLPLGYTWAFGDGVIESGRSASVDHAFATPSVHTVIVTATNCGGGGRVDDAAQVLAYEPCRPLTAITATADSPLLVGEPMQFQAVVTPTDATQPVDYAWDFGAAGAGSGLDGPTPVFTYTEAGAHTVTVTATNCTDTLLFTETAEVVYAFPVVVGNFCQPLTGIGGSADDPVLEGQAMQFQTVVTPTGATPPISYTWAFGAAGDGSGLDGPTPVFTYTEAGMHTVTVTATNCTSANLLVDPGVVTHTWQVGVQKICEPVSEITPTANSPVRLGQPMLFTATVTPTNATQPVNYAWDFGATGDGSGLDGPNPVFTYSQRGFYTAIVTATNCARTLIFTDGSLTLYTGLVTAPISVEVRRACEPLVEVRVSADDPVPLGQPVHFQATLTPIDATPPVSYVWDFGAPGSGSGLNGPDPVFTYSQGGVYNVVVAAVNCAGVGLDVTQRETAVSSGLFLPVVMKGWAD